ncbi:TPA: glycosyltransferase family 25 protein [Campylobacter jejuni]
MKIFIINLERSQDRREKMEMEIQTLFDSHPYLKDKLEFIFFKAIDANKQEHERFNKHFTCFSKFYAGGEGMSAPEKACFASHYLLWKKCLELDEKIIILEDDMGFNEEFVEKIDIILNLDYECLRFAYKAGKIAYYVDKNIGLVLKNNSYGAFAYMLHPIGARKLLKKASKWFCPVDYYLDMFYFHGVWHLMYDIWIFKSLSGKTTIHHVKISIWEKMTRKIMRPIVKFISHIYKVIYLLFNNPKKRFKNNFYVKIDKKS